MGQWMEQETLSEISHINKTMLLFSQMQILDFSFTCAYMCMGV